MTISILSEASKVAREIAIDKDEVQREEIARATEYACDALIWSSFKTWWADEKAQSYIGSSKIYIDRATYWYNARNEWNYLRIEFYKRVFGFLMVGILSDILFEE